MKKYLLLLAGLLFAVPHGEAEAKVAKLGRGRAYSIATDSTVNTGAGKTELRKGECESNEECSSDKKCMNYKCVDVCTQPTGNGISYARICAGQKCVADPSTPHTFMCVDGCYNVVCKSGYTTEVTSTGCCCVATSCPSGQRLESGTCVANCTGVTCKSGYKAVSSSTGCCCEADTPTCSGAQVYNAVIGKCVSAVCPNGCSSGMCSSGYCTKCDSGRYMNYEDGMCPTCSNAIANCATCTSSSSGVTCTACDSGYTLSNGKCTVTCPANCSTCSSPTTCTKCATGYSLSSTGKCTLTLSSDCTKCDSGYTKNLTTCPSGKTLQYGRVCADSGFTCGKCV